MVVGIRSDLAYAASVFGRYNSRLQERHHQMAKRVLRFLKGTTERGLEFTRTRGLGENPVIDVYADASHDLDINTRRSTTGGSSCGTDASCPGFLVCKRRPACPLLVRNTSPSRQLYRPSNGSRTLWQTLTSIRISCYTLTANPHKAWLQTGRQRIESSILTFATTTSEKDSTLEIQSWFMSRHRKTKRISSRSSYRAPILQL